MKVTGDIAKGGESAKDFGNLYETNSGGGLGFDCALLYFFRLRVGMREQGDSPVEATWWKVLRLRYCRERAQRWLP